MNDAERKTGEPGNRDLLEYWNNLSEEDSRKSRAELIEDMAERLGVPVEIVKKTLADWEAGKNIV